MDIKLKCVKFSEHMSEETNAFTANLYLNNKKIGYCKNEGHGGETMVQSFTETREKFIECEEYCKTLPPKTYTFNDVEHSYDNNLECVVDDLFEQWLENREQKKRERKMKTHLMWGVPNSNSYSTVNFKQPLDTVKKNVLQSYIDKFKKDFKVGEVYLNTNLTNFNL